MTMTRDATVIRLYSDFVDVALDSPRGTTAPPVIVTSRLRGRLLVRASHEKNVFAVGDRVAVTQEGDEWMVESLTPRRSKFSRRHPGSLHLEQVIAANVDQVLVVAAVERPVFRPDLVDLHLVAASAAGLPALLILTKCDLVTAERVEHLAKRYRKIQLPMVRLALGDDPEVDRSTLPEIVRLRRDILGGKVTVMVGQSGVGKSTLRNALLGPASGRAATAPVSDRSGEGRHVTSAATFEPLSPSGFLVDTPGIRELSPWNVSASDVQQHFPEFAEAECRFSDCHHVTEPGCGVRALVERGDAAPERLASLLAIRDALG